MKELTHPAISRFCKMADSGIDAAYHEVSPPRDGGNIHPSGSGSCPRKRYYAYYSEEYESVPNGLSYKGCCPAIVGTLLHDNIQALLASVFEGSEFVVNFEVPMPEDTYFELYDMKGTADGVIEVGDIRILLEMKTTSDSTYDTVRKNGPSSGHTRQATIYATRMDCQYILYFHLNRNNFDHKWTVQEVDDEVVEEILIELESLKEAIDNKVLPEREENWVLCDYCPWKKECNPPVLARKGQMKKSNARRKASRGSKKRKGS